MCSIQVNSLRYKLLLEGTITMSCSGNAQLRYRTLEKGNLNNVELIAELRIEIWKFEELIALDLSTNI